MNEPDRFPWKPALTGASLMVLGLLTVSIRADVATEGNALLRLEHQRSSLHRRERDLQIRLQREWQEIGRDDPVARKKGGSRS